METKIKQWADGSSATIQYDGQGDGEIIITSDPNEHYEARSMQITVETTDGSGLQKTVNITQAAKQRIDLSAAVVTAANQTYSGGGKTPTPTVTLNGSTVPSSGYDVSYSNNINAGTATITVTGKGDYTGTAYGTFTINKVTPTVTAPTRKSLTYSGVAQTLANAGSTDYGTLQYSADNSTWSTTIPTGTDASTNYKVYYRVVGDSNINDVASANISCSISQKSLSITAKAQTITYGSSISQSTSQVTTSGLVSGDSLTSITLTQSTSSVTSSGTITPSNATTSKGISNYSVSYYTGTLTITQATGYITFLFDSIGATYNPYDTTASLRVSTSSSGWEKTTAKTVGGYNVFRSISNKHKHGSSSVMKLTFVNTTGAAVTTTVKVGPATESSYDYVYIAQWNASDISPSSSTAPSSTIYSGSGKTAEWTDVPITIPTGTNTLQIVYRKDSSVSNEPDCGYFALPYNVSMTSLVGSSIEYNTNASISYSSSNTSVVSVNSSTGAITINGVGTATITANASSTTQYSSCSDTCTITVSAYKVAPTYTAPTARSLTYSGSAQYLTTTGSTSHGTIQYSNDETNWYTTRRQGTNAGSYTTYWRLIGDSYHNDIASTSISVTIAQATGSVTTAPSARDVTYTGSSQYLVTAGSGTGTMYYRYKLSTSSSWSSWSTTRPSRTNAGTYNIEYYAAASSNGNYTQSATGSLNVEMKKAASSVTAAPTAKTLTYSRGSQSLVNAGTASGGTMYYLATTTNSKPSSTSSFSSSIPTKTSAGTYYVWYYVKGDSNHTNTAISSTSVSVTISKATPVISTAPSKRTGLSYTGSAQNLLSGGAMKHSSSDSTSVSGTFTYAKGTNAGTYSGLTWSFAPTDTTNYNSTNGSVSGSVTIAKASRTVSWSSAPTSFYAGSKKTLSATVSAGSSDGTLSYSSSNSNVASVSGTTVTGVSSGTATITAAISEGTNYNAASATYSITIIAVPSGYVNMGLPSGILWADRNVGASTPYTYECKFFSWGNTDGHEPTSSSSFGSYSWGTSNTTEPYVSSAGAALTSNIPLSQDAARVNLGSPNRMPTSVEIKELFDNIKYINADGTEVSSSSADKRVTVNGIVGLYLESKINGNRLFFACSGNGYGTSWNGRGSNGNYWATMMLSSTNARYLDFSFSGVVPLASSLRFRGFAVRAVQ